MSRKARTTRRKAAAPPGAEPPRFSPAWLAEGYRRYRLIGAVVAALLLVGAAVGKGALDAVSDKARQAVTSALDQPSRASAADPLRITVRTAAGSAECPRTSFLLPSLAALRGSPSPSSEYGSEEWIHAHGGVPAVGVVYFTVQTPSASAVLLTGLRAVVDRRQPASGVRVGLTSQCGGEVDSRYFAVDLQAASPRVAARPGVDGYTGTTVAPAVTFPFKVSATDPEVFVANVGDVTGDLTWHLELDWVADGNPGHSRLPERGAFRTSSGPEKTVERFGQLLDGS
ncbi:hypothetical protein GCE86_10210 [Micromonospora terminaliae]|uniref:Uncharacterized protein n=1 Tax=Micromonospora terminaliae TaxID=1914461 RepID=A0AAJ2ZDK4_9ACTN|nr:hypothetical protein [Micromonospora terminaliae]NES27853.1 hypothetical protein [Micromonospora terminaliae]QGL47369.1 hypothetical protein GCE86_10210 [Micromonospora terminaliae]